MEKNAQEIVIYMDEGEEDKEIRFNEENLGLYRSSDQGILIEVEHAADYEDGRRYRFVRIAEKYQKCMEQILSQFENKYEERVKEQKESFESGLEYDDNEGGGRESGITVPYDPQLITVAQARFSLKEIVSMVDGEEDEEPVLDLDLLSRGIMCGTMYANPD